MSVTAIVALLVLTLVTLAGVNAINIRQRQLKQLARRQQTIEQQLETEEMALTTCLRSLEGYTVASQINRDMVTLIEQLVALERFSTEPLKARLALTRQRQAQLDRAGHPRQLNRLCDSDAEIMDRQSSLMEATRVIRRRQGAQLLAQPQAQEALNQIDWARLQLSVLSMVGAGYRAREADQLISALNYFQRAQDLLQGSNNPDPRRLEMVRQLSDILRHQRDYLAPELFPEYPIEPGTGEPVAEDDIDTAH